MKYFKFWCQKVLPLVYDESLSYYEVLCKVIDYLNNIIKDMNGFDDKINNFYNELNNKINNNKNDIEQKLIQLKENLEKLITDNINDINNEIIGLKQDIDFIIDWIHHFDYESLINFIEKTVDNYIATSIFIEISNDGYIVYFIPEKWSDITFNTTSLDIFLPEEPEYGHLVLTY